MPRPRFYATRAEKDAAYYQRKKQRQQYPPLPPGPYRVIYADPPWQYASTDPYYHGHARDRYPTLSIAELKKSTSSSTRMLRPRLTKSEAREVLASNHGRRSRAWSGSAIRNPGGVAPPMQRAPMF